MTDCDEIALLRSYSKSQSKAASSGGSGTSSINGKVLWSDEFVEQFECEMLVGASQEKTIVQKIALSDQYYSNSKQRSAGGGAGIGGGNESNLNKFYQVPWVIDECVPECMLCSTPFTLWSFLLNNRRHHCRGCGRGVCDACSQARIRIKNYYEVEGSRLCKKCVLARTTKTISAPNNDSKPSMTIESNSNTNSKDTRLSVQDSSADNNSINNNLSNGVGTEPSSAPASTSIESAATESQPNHSSSSSAAGSSSSSSTAVATSDVDICPNDLEGSPSKRSAAGLSINQVEKAEILTDKIEEASTSSSSHNNAPINSENNSNMNSKIEVKNVEKYIVSAATENNNIAATPSSSTPTTTTAISETDSSTPSKDEPDSLPSNSMASNTFIAPWSSSPSSSTDGSPTNNNTADTTSDNAYSRNNNNNNNNNTFSTPAAKEAANEDDSIIQSVNRDGIWEESSVSSASHSESGFSPYSTTSARSISPMSTRGFTPGGSIATPVKRAITPTSKRLGNADTGGNVAATTPSVTSGPETSSASAVSAQERFETPDRGGSLSPSGGDADGDILSTAKKVGVWEFDDDDSSVASSVATLTPINTPTRNPTKVEDDKKEEQPAMQNDGVGASISSVSPAKKAAGKGKKGKK